MQSQNSAQSRIRRTVDELVIAEMFFIQATIESAAVIGNGINELGKHIGHSDESGAGSRAVITEVLQRIADDAVEPYASRFKYFRDMLDADD